MIQIGEYAVRLTLLELTAFTLGAAFAGLLSFWIYCRKRNDWHAGSAAEIEASNQAHAAELALRQRDLDYCREILHSQRVDCDQLRHSHDSLQAGVQAARQEIAALTLSASRVPQLENEKSQLEAQLRQLQADHRALEALAGSEKRALQEKLTLLQQTREDLSRDFQLLANRIFEDKQAQFNEQSRQTLNASVEPLKNQIESFRKKVEDAYDKENAERNRLVGQIAELRKQTQRIGEDAISLTNALKGDNKVQGNWGEVILERLLEQSGLQRGREYEVQMALQNEDGRRRNPDVVVHLPEKKDIIIDSKVSLLHYEQYVNAAEEERPAHLRLLLASLRTHIQQLSQKSYEQLAGVRSLDFVFMFVPVEAAFMLAMQSDQNLFQDAYNRQIIVVSPTTLLASLRTVENIWRYEKQNRNAEEIARQAGGLHDQFVLLVEAMADIEKQIRKTDEAYQLAYKRLTSGRGNLIRRIDGLRELGARTRKQLSTSMDTPEVPEAELRLVGPEEP